MIMITINGKQVRAQENSSLKNVLEKEGLAFPCNGVGKCGKCRIKCLNLGITELDKRFLSSSQIEQGLRLACDKTVKHNLDINFEKTIFSVKTKRMEYCNIAVIIGSQKITIGILDEELVEKIIINNDCKTTIEIRSLIAKHCIEFFEKYSLAKADTIAVAANGFWAELLLGEKSEGYGESYDALDYMLPAETLYILPFINSVTGGDFLSSALGKSVPRIIISASDVFAAALFNSEDIFYIVHEGVSYFKSELIALKASVNYLLSHIDRPPVFSIYGEKAVKITGILKNYSYAIEEDSILEMVARTTNENRLKNQLFKMRKKVVELSTVENDKWQDELILSANNSDD